MMRGFFLSNFRDKDSVVSELRRVEKMPKLKKS
jgi:hypothetical protein